MQALGSKLRIPRYDFISKPGGWTLLMDGDISKDLDQLLKDWIGDKPVTILDLSGVPHDILKLS